MTLMCSEVYLVRWSTCSNKFHS